jgi:rod shape-determining protein MreC
MANNHVKNGHIQSIAIQFMGHITEPVWKARQILDSVRENHELRYENALLKLENASLMEAYYENIRLRKLLNVGLIENFNCIPAKILGRNFVGIHSVLLSAGKDQGVKVNMPIISAEGLAGKIISVSSDYSTAQLLIDRNFRVAARDQKTRVEGIFQWTEGEYGRMMDVHHRAEIEKGDQIITSGMSSLFPPGLPIGMVTKIEDRESVLFKTVWVKPFVDFRKLEEVFVIQTRN